MDSLGQQADQSEIAEEDLEEEKEGSGDAEANKFSFRDFQILQVALFYNLAKPTLIKLPEG